MKANSNFSLIFYIFVFLLAFGRFLPFPLQISFLNDFFNNYGFVLTYLNIIPLIGFVIFKLVQFFRRGSQDRYEITLGFSALIIYVCFLFLIPTFKTLNHQLIIFANKEQTVENFSNPILGYQMEIRSACEFGSSTVRVPIQNEGRGNGITTEIKEETTFAIKPCGTIRYAVFESHEFGLTETADHLIYFQWQVTLSDVKRFEDLKRDYKNGWYYLHWSAALKLF